MQPRKLGYVRGEQRDVRAVLDVREAQAVAGHFGDGRGEDAGGGKQGPLFRGGVHARTGGRVRSRRHLWHLHPCNGLPCSARRCP